MRSIRQLFVACLLLGALGATQAQLLRHLPPEAKRAEMTPPQPNGAVTLDGERRMLAPGAMIRDRDNRIVMPSSLSAPVRVKYLLDPQGALLRVWILTDDELARPDPPTPAAPPLR